MRRKPGTLFPIEASILIAGFHLAQRGETQFHGFAIAKRMEEIGEAARLTAHGTLYKALSRMEAAGLLESEWEDAEVALRQGRPRRRLYRITGGGEKALAAFRQETGSNRNPRGDLAPT